MDITIQLIYGVWMASSSNTHSPHDTFTLDFA